MIEAAHYKAFHITVASDFVTNDYVTDAILNTEKTE